MPKVLYRTLDDALTALEPRYHKVIFGSVPPPKMLYHYCRQKDMEGILESGTLWATDALNARDRDEMLHSVRIITPILQERGADGNPRFFLGSMANENAVLDGLRSFSPHIACLSNDPAIASQWQKYAECGRGVAIGFDYQRTVDICNGKRILGPFPVVYGRKQQTCAVRRYLAEATFIVCRSSLCVADEKELRSHATAGMFGFMISIKKWTYREEGEWRLVVLPNGPDGEFAARTDEDGRSYVQLPICGAVSEVVIGRCSKLSEYDVRRFLRTAGLENARVRKSRVAQPTSNPG